MIKTEAQLKIEELERQLENARHERDLLRATIAEATEALGHDGHSSVDLRDAVKILERLLDGKDVDAGLDFDPESVFGKVEALVWLVQFAGTDNDKTEHYAARLDFEGSS